MLDGIWINQVCGVRCLFHLIRGAVYGIMNGWQINGWEMMSSNNDGIEAVVEERDREGWMGFVSMNAFFAGGWIHGH